MKRCHLISNGASLQEHPSTMIKLAFGAAAVALLVLFPYLEL